jgi:multiple sugar transport system ATP-binding protein
VEQVGAPLELYEFPVNLFVAGFIGSPKMNFIEGEIVSASSAAAEVRLKSGAVIRAEVDASAAKPGDSVTLGVRPEHLDPAAAVNKIQSTVAFVESLGNVTHAYLAYPGVEEALNCDLGGNVGIVAGDTLEVGIPAASCHLFDAQGRAFKRHFKFPSRRAA